MSVTRRLRVRAMHRTSETAASCSPSLRMPWRGQTHRAPRSPSSTVSFSLTRRRHHGRGGLTAARPVLHHPGAPRHGLQHAECLDGAPDIGDCFRELEPLANTVAGLRCRLKNGRSRHRRSIGYGTPRLPTPAPRSPTRSMGRWDPAVVLVLPSGLLPCARRGQDRPDSDSAAASMEISFEAWEGVQRRGQDLADRLAQGFTGLLQAPPQFPWPPAPHKRMPFDIDLPVVPFGARRGAPGKDFPFPAAAVYSVLDIGGRLGQAGTELGASVGGAVSTP